MKHILNYIFLFIISLFTYAYIWHSNTTPYPFVLNWDIFEHITLANKIAQGHLSIFTSQISDTFTIDSYSPLFHILLSVPKALFSIDLLGIYYTLEYFYFYFTVIATYLLAKKIFTSNWIAFISGIFSIFIFENFMAYTSFFLIPQNLTALLTIFSLIYVSNKNFNKILLGALLLTIFLIHYVVGILGVLIILGYLLARKLSSRVLNWSILASTVVLFLLAGSNYLGNFVLTSREEASHFLFPLASKLGFLLDWYSLSFLFLPISYYFIFKHDNKNQKIILSLALLILGISIAPFSYFLKFFVFDHYLLNIILASGIGFMIFHFSKFMKILSVIWVGLFLSVVFYKSQYQYKEPLYFNGQASQISHGEISASKWLAENEPANSFIISDPGTQYIFEAISGLNSQGGAYMSTDTRKILIEKDIAKIKTIKDKLDFENKSRGKTIFIFSGRYFAWQKLPEEQKLSFYYNIWKPQKLSVEELSYIDLLTRDSNYKLIYQNNELAIFEI